MALLAVSCVLRFSSPDARQAGRLNLKSFKFETGLRLGECRADSAHSGFRVPGFWEVSDGSLGELLSAQGLKFH